MTTTFSPVINSDRNTDQTVKITPLDDALGAVVTGLDASKPLEPATILRLKQAHRNYHILIFKNQKLTDEQLKTSLSILAIFLFPLMKPLSSHLKWA